MKVGDIVLVTDIATPRNLWPLARGVEGFYSDDGIVRRLKVATAKKTLTRAPVSLCLLEGNCD